MPDVEQNEIRKSRICYLARSLSKGYYTLLTDKGIYITKVTECRR